MTVTETDSCLCKQTCIMFCFAGRILHDFDVKIQRNVCVFQTAVQNDWRSDLKGLKIYFLFISS